LTRYLELYRAANSSAAASSAAAAAAASNVTVDDEPRAAPDNSNAPLIVPSTEPAEFIDLPPPKFEDDDAQ
jgi:hypothetical protein